MLVVYLYLLYLFLLPNRVLKEKPWAPSRSRYPAATSSSVLPLSLMVRDGLSFTLELFVILTVSVSSK